MAFAEQQITEELKRCLEEIKQTAKEIRKINLYINKAEEKISKMEKEGTYMEMPNIEDFKAAKEEWERERNKYIKRIISQHNKLKKCMDKLNNIISFLRGDLGKNLAKIHVIESVNTDAPELSELKMRVEKLKKKLEPLKRLYGEAKKISEEAEELKKHKHIFEKKGEFNVCQICGHKERVEY